MPIARRHLSIPLSRSAIAYAACLGAVAAGVTVSVTFATPGTYSYEDPYFTAVTGIVVVQ